MVGFSWSLVHIHKEVQWVCQALLWGHRRRRGGGWKADATPRTSPVLWTNGSSHDSKFWTLSNSSLHSCESSSYLSCGPVTRSHLFLPFLPREKTGAEVGLGHHRCAPRGTWLVWEPPPSPMLLCSAVSFTSDFFPLFWRGVDLVLALSCLWGSREVTENRATSQLTTDAFSDQVTFGTSGYTWCSPVGTSSLIFFERASYRKPKKTHL